MLKDKNKILLNELPLIPLRDIVIFPNVIVPLLVGRNKSIKAVKESQDKYKHLIFLVTQKNLNADDPAVKDLYSVGIIAEILQAFNLPDGSVKILVEGKQKAKAEKFLSSKDYVKVKISSIVEKPENPLDFKALIRSVQNLFENYVKLNKKLPVEAAVTTMNIENPEYFINIISSNLTIKISEKQKLLEIAGVKEKLQFLAHILTVENDLMQVEKKIMNDVKKQVDTAHKNFYLHEQLKAIEKELGKKEEDFKDIEELRKKINKAALPKEIKDITERQIEKLSLMMPLSPEAAVCRNYIEWLIDLPWEKRTEDNLDIKTAQRILEEDHYGLEKPKERILEYLAVRKLSKNTGAQILCFTGPPGVGKTSLAKSIARALGRKFVRVSLGGIRDEAEIRGHRRTYVGALPGRIIQSLKKAGSKNPVFLLDEIDKMAMDFRGDPTSALLEVLDPEQNHSFSDHYLEVGFDLSEVMFITTSNVRENIPLPLQDRMEIIKIAGYTDYEKIKIAATFLLPKQIKACGLKNSSLEISDEAIMKIIRGYTQEAGVRNLERELSNICRKVARQIVEKDKDVQIKVTAENVYEFLGTPHFSEDRTEKNDEVGVANGLAWTEAGGEVMTVETSVLKGKGKSILTGKLGDVMKESAHAALSYIRSRTKELGLSMDFYRAIDIHVHIPEGAIPKDGPSAGITMASAIISSLTKRPVRRDVAMTGEITLRGRVLPVGGLKSKILAAHRAGIKKIIIPKENKKDLEEIPALIMKDLEIILVENMDEVIKTALLLPKNNIKNPALGKKNSSGLAASDSLISQVSVS